ncbi:hypothetical protein BIW11_08716 [Tropilaelaps mercedesae]|uniref:Uncharacterized protein n=1 Tax=Tropilaelaps mercedesae TaxID=418985 RepID=A0A1V9XNC0_9ACAR|nr:hypothetical protein BIW11_08716 [Tropilaelaps mercedesae]
MSAFKDDNAADQRSTPSYERDEENEPGIEERSETYSGQSYPAGVDSGGSEGPETESVDETLPPDDDEADTEDDDAGQKQYRRFLKFQEEQRLLRRQEQQGNYGNRDGLQHAAEQKHLQINRLQFLTNRGETTSEAGATLQKGVDHRRGLTEQIEPGTKSGRENTSLLTGSSVRFGRKASPSSMTIRQAGQQSAPLPATRLETRPKDCTADSDLWARVWNLQQQSAASNATNSTMECDIQDGIVTRPSSNFIIENPLSEDGPESILQPTALQSTLPSWRYPQDASPASSTASGDRPLKSALKSPKPLTGLVADSGCSKGGLANDSPRRGAAKSVSYLDTVAVNDGGVSILKGEQLRKPQQRQQHQGQIHNYSRSGSVDHTAVPDSYPERYTSPSGNFGYDQQQQQSDVYQRNAAMSPDSSSALYSGHSGKQRHRFDSLSSSITTTSVTTSGTPADSRRSSETVMRQPYAQTAPISPQSATDHGPRASQHDGGTPVQQQQQQPTKKSTPTSHAGRSWLGGIFGKLLPRGPNQMILPEDKDQAIVWDPEKKCWIDKSADSVTQDAVPVAPPSDAALGATPDVPTIPMMASVVPASQIQQQSISESDRQPVQPLPLMNPQSQNPPPQPNGTVNKYQRNRGARARYVDVLKQSSQTVSSDALMAPVSIDNVSSLSPMSSTGGTGAMPNFFVPVPPTGPQAEPFDLMSHRSDYEETSVPNGASGDRPNIQHQPVN